MITIRVQQNAFDPGKEVSVFCRANAGSGGIATFVGQMRDFQGEARESGKAVSSMTLEHYPGMAERQLNELCEEAAGRWEIDAVTVVHRFGDFTPGDPIVLVAVASAHRDPAFDACRFLMDWLKTQAPFWKKEFTDTDSSWVAAKESDNVRASRWKAR